MVYGFARMMYLNSLMTRRSEGYVSLAPDRANPSAVVTQIVDYIASRKLFRAEEEQLIFCTGKGSNQEYHVLVVLQCWQAAQGH